MPVPPLFILPPELLLKIIGNLKDLEDLFSAILTCRRIFDIFQEAQRPLIKSTFAKYFRLNTEQELYKVLTQLSCIVRRGIVRSDFVCHIFEIGWGIFKQKYQELLIPFGRALAWSYVLDGRRGDAVCLLQLIQNGEPPFGWSMRSLSQLPLQPIRDLLEHLDSEGNGVDGTYVSSNLEYPLAEFKRKPKRSAIHLCHSEQSNLLKDGLLFRKNSIVMRTRQPYPMRPYPMRTSAKHMLNYTFYRRQPMLNDTMNRDIVEALAHRPTKAYAQAGQYRS